MSLRLLAALLLLAATDARAEGFGFDRVDLVSEDPGLWLNYELPGALSYPVRPALRFVTQLKAVWTTPVEGLYVGTSLSSQSVAYEKALPFGKGLFWSASLQTRLLMPRGVGAGLAWRWKRLRVGAGVNAVSGAAWVNPSWSSWTVVPTIGIGVGRSFEAP